MDTKQDNRGRASEEPGAVYSDAYYRAAPETRRACYGYSPAQWTARASEEPSAGEPAKKRRGAAFFTTVCLICVLAAAALGVGGMYLIMRGSGGADAEPSPEPELYLEAANAAEKNADTLAEGGADQGEELTAEAVFLGLSLTGVTPGTARYYDMVQGVYVCAVDQGSPAAEAGILPGDVITALDGEAVADSGPLLRRLLQRTGTDAAELTIWRGGEQLCVRMFTAPPSIDPPGASS